MGMERSKAGTRERRESGKLMDAVRFVAVWTLKRGALKRPEVLDDANQWRAFSAWRMDASGDVRAAFELGETVVWARPVASAGGRVRERRLA